MRRVRQACFFAVLAALSFTPSGLAAQGAPNAGDGKQASAASLQTQANEKFIDLKNTMRRLEKVLESSEPDKAKRIRNGLRLLHEAELDEAMTSIERMLREESWDSAIQGMDRVQKKLNQLLNLLMDRDRELNEILEEIARLEALKEKLDNVLEEQRAEKDRSAEAEALEEHLRDIERAKKDVRRLIEEQKGVRSDTKNQGAGAENSAELSNKQGDVKEGTEQLGSDLAEIEAQAREIEAGEAGEGKPGEGKPGEGSGKASSSAGKAAEAMGGAQAKLSRNQPEDSLDDQDEALDELERTERALGDLEEDAQRRLMEIPFEKLEQAQLDTMNKTQNLAEEMEKAEAEGSGEDGDAGGKPIPGKQNVEQAVPKQKNAAGSLKEVKPGKAKKKQKDAEDELEEAKRKLEDALAQLRQELQDEVLRALEERFTEMLARQKELTLRTGLTDRSRTALEAIAKAGIVPASIRNACQQIAQGELDLRAECQSALHLIEEEGSTAVFPEVVKELAEDLATIASVLDGFETGDGTQAMQKQIEKTLEALIDALTRRIEQQDGGEGGSCEGGEQPLVPLSAELRMLKIMQLGVNAQTKLVNSLDEGSKKRARLADKTSGKQGKVENLTRKLARKLQKDDEDPDGDGEGR